jgi:Ca2+-dependent lipid-binding protein
MSHSRGTLDVTIVEGRHLKDEGRHMKDEHVVHKNDAYVEVYVDKDYKQRTKIVKDSNDPKWNQKFTL